MVCDQARGGEVRHLRYLCKRRRSQRPRDGITAAAPGSAEGGLVVSDIEAAHDELVGRGIDASEVWHGASFPLEARVGGPDPKRTSYGSFCSFNDPDGNTWLVQEVTTRHPGRI